MFSVFLGAKLTESAQLGLRDPAHFAAKFSHSNSPDQERTRSLRDFKLWPPSCRNHSWNKSLFFTSMNDAVNVLSMGMQLLCISPSIGTLEADLRLQASLKERYKSEGAPAEAVVIIPAGYAVYSDCEGKNSKTLSSISIRAYRPRNLIEVEFAQ